MRRILAVAVIFLLAVGALNLITVEVKPIDEHEGAVAYAMPEVRTSFLGGSTTGVRIATAPDGASPILEVKPHAYVGPKPTTKSLWQILLPTGCLTLNCGAGGDLGGTGGSAGCSVTKTETKQVMFDSYAVVKIVGPGGKNWDYRSENKTTTMDQKVDYLACASMTSKIAWTFAGFADYDVGTFYFTNGWGTYAFTVEIWLIVPGSADAKLGSTQLAVTPTA